ncbi:ribosomal protein-alanine acetyltransferase RimI-like protein [Nitzschia inconspicua]|uniref:Ribosomal protein-alanine acetyltransferase RimI-like protein n=1 Tax=Nitzschia inconspicua TaxID=303405 RepID=A0A9K3KN04_9STRA|nr:ribosomal protein-alanine acetyltransferase RimI-like protein [Nitzschia inconspicua]
MAETVTQHLSVLPEDSSSDDKKPPSVPQIVFVNYENESQINDVMRLVALDLSEPYSIFTYRYFLHRFPDLCIMAVDQTTGDVCGCVVGKIDLETAASPTMLATEESLDGEQSSADQHLPTPVTPQQQQTGYIGMLAVSKLYRRRGIGKALVKQVLQRMEDRGCTSVTLETEVSNKTAQELYQNFGFVREELLVRYYLNNSDAYRLRLWFCR